MTEIKTIDMVVKKMPSKEGQHKKKVREKKKETER